MQRKRCRRRKLTKFRQFRGDRTCSFLALSGQGCQCAQRLWKSLHSDDAEAIRVAPSLARVIPSRDEEDVRLRLADAERLLLDAPDLGDRAVQLDLSGRGDAIAAI